MKTKHIDLHRLYTATSGPNAMIFGFDNLNENIIRYNHNKPRGHMSAS